MTTRQEGHEVYLNTPRSARTLHELTENDSKVLGERITSRLRKTLPDQAFKTAGYKNVNSNWTPKTHRKATNEDIFSDRCDLIFNWFDLWTNAQRCRFIYRLFASCAPAQMDYVRDWVDSRVPVPRLDFCTVLPRHLSLKILGYLDPRSLSRAACVSWHWYFTASQDALWKHKCQTFGWYLPYTPTSLEVGAWKQHYIRCSATLELTIGSITKDAIYGTWSDGCVTERTLNVATRKRHDRLTEAESRAVLEDRPVWMPPSGTPNDLATSQRALFAGFNPNNVKSNAELYRESVDEKENEKTLAHPKHSIVNRQDNEKSIEELDDSGVRETSLLLSESMLQSNIEESMQFLSQPDFRDQETAQEIDLSVRRKDGQGFLPEKYLLPWQRIEPASQKVLHGLASNYEGFSNPRIMFISSRTICSEMLIAAIKFGVIPILYEYEGTTLSTLIYLLKSVLRGRLAQSIGVFGLHDDPGISHVNLVHGRSIRLADLDHPEIRQFCEELASNTLPSEEPKFGHVDFFAPLAAFNDGTEALIELKILTGMDFLSPQTLLNQFDQIQHVWTECPEKGKHPADLYFEQSKLCLWTETAEKVQDATVSVRKYINQNYEELRNYLISKLIGDVVFETIDKKGILEMRRISAGLTEALTELNKYDNKDSFEFISRYLERHFCKRNSPKKKDQSKQKDDYFNESQSINQSLLSTNANFADHPDKRFQIIESIISSEFKYIQILEMVKKEYYTPLKKSLDSNKAILAVNHVQTMFAILLKLLDLHRDLYADLTAKMTANFPKNTSETCRDGEVAYSTLTVGDIFVERAPNWLQLLTRYIEQYPVMLSTLDRCTEINPVFRSFFLAKQFQPETKMTALRDVFMLPIRRLSQYERLLHWLSSNTPPDHADKPQVEHAYRLFQKEANFVREQNLKMLHDRELSEIEKSIDLCPVLNEEGRFFVLKKTFSLMSIIDEKTKDPDILIYRYMALFELYLFNDCLMLCRSIAKSIPYESKTSKRLIFQIAVQLRNIRVVDIADSKYIKNAFTISSKKRKWIFSASTLDEKFQFISCLNQNISARKF